MKRYTIRKLPSSYSRLAGRYGGREYEVALFDPEGQIIARSWNAANLRRLRDHMNDAYELGYVSGKLAKRGRPPGVSAAGKKHQAWFERLKILN